MLTLRDGLPHPDLSVMLDEDGRDGITLEQRAAERCLTIPGNVDRDRGDEIEEAIWEKMHFARHMRTERLGVFSVGTDEGHRSESLAITQVLILYHLVTAKASVAVGGDDAPAREPTRDVPSPA